MRASKPSSFRSAWKRCVFLSCTSLLVVRPLLADTQVVLKLDGKNAKGTVATFRVSDRWELTWTSPSFLHVTVLASDGSIVTGAAAMLNGSIFEQKGGTYSVQLSGPGAIPTTTPWSLTVLQLDQPSAADKSLGVANDVLYYPPATATPTTPPSRLTSAKQFVATPAANGASTNGVTLAPSPNGQPPPTAVVTNLTPEQSAAVVLIEGDHGEGTGFLVKMPDGPAIVTNLHVLSGNTNLRILTSTGAQIYPSGLKGAMDRDLALLPIQDDHYSYLAMASSVGSAVQANDEVITPGNSQGGEVTLATHGSVLAVGPQRVEFSNPIYHGNSGGPVFQVKTGQVIAVVTEAMKVDTTNSLDKASFASRDSAIKNSMRYFGLRLDTVAQWETYDPARYLSETTFLDDFHEQSRRLDSYLNSDEHTDRENSNQSNDEENGRPNSKLYLSDKKICKANTDFFAETHGSDAAERLDAFRQWIFAINSIVEQGMAEAQTDSNFYTFDRERARDELAYRNALKEEVQSYGDDADRADSLRSEN